MFIVRPSHICSVLALLLLLSFVSSILFKIQNAVFVLQSVFVRIARTRLSAARVALHSYPMNDGDPLQIKLKRNGQGREASRTKVRKHKVRIRKVS